MTLSKKALLAAFVFAGVGAAGYRIHQVYQTKARADTKGKKGAGARLVTVTVDRARIGMVDEEIVITSALRPTEQVDVMPKATGRITRLAFQVGDVVTKGALIAELEDAELQQQVNRASAALEVARASMATGQRQRRHPPRREPV
jgi:multidrug efflux pump subunit AcrA (membrane-fusion protein)